MGIAMGQPFFQIRGLCRQGLVALSGDLAYYASVSREVMDCIGRFSDVVEQYSVDECFFNLHIRSVTDPLAYVCQMREQVARQVGVPVAIGVAPTKTLAKAASERAKKEALPAWQVTEEGRRAFLASLPVGEVWGVGRQTEAKLTRMGLTTALAFAEADLFVLKKRMSVRESQLALELRGQRQWPLVTAQPQAKSLQVTRTMPEIERRPEVLWQTLRGHAVEAVRRIQLQHLQTARVSAFMRTSWFSPWPKKVAGQIKLSRPTDQEPEIVKAVKSLFDRIYEPQWDYRALGVTLHDLTDGRFVQLTLEDLLDQTSRKRQKLAELSAFALRTAEGDY